MKHLSHLVGAVALTSAAALCQSVIVPQGFTTAGGNGTSANYWRAGVCRFQIVYDTANFTAQGINQPIDINQVEFRLTGTTAVVTYPAVDVYLQQAAVDHLAYSTTFASNRTVAIPGATPNYSGPVTTATPTATYVTIPLTTPFTFDPTAGVDLLIEVEIQQAPTPATANTQDCAYATAAPWNYAATIRNTGSLTSLTGTFSGFTPIVNFSYTPTPGAAAVTNLGTGCISRYASLYELFTNPATFDLQNSAVTFIPTGGAWVVTRTGSWLPIGSVQTTPTVLALGDDATINYPFTTGSFPGWTGLEICSNGYVAQAAGNTTVAAPTIATTLNAPQTAFYCQLDLDPIAPGTGQGTIQVEESASVTTVTWNGVTNWNPTTGGAGAAPCDIQFQFHASGLVTIAWGANMSPFQNNGGILVGYSPGGTNTDPGNTDVSALGAGSVLLEAVDTPPLALTATTRPVLGTSWNLDLANIPATSFVGVDIFGASDPGINDLSFLGMPGCGLRASLDATNAWVVSGPTHSYSFSVPNLPSLVGFNLFTTSAVFQFPPSNGFGAMTSNGVQGTLGSV